MILKSMSLRTFFYITVLSTFILFSILIFLKVNQNYRDETKKKFIYEIEYLAKVTSDMIKKSENDIVNEAKVISNFESVYYAFKEKKFLSDHWEMKDNEINIKTRETTELEYKKLMSSITNTIYQSGIGHLQGEKMLEFFDENLELTAASYDFPEKFKDTGKEVYMEAAIGGKGRRLSVDASEMSVIQEKDNEIMVKGISPIGKYIRFSSNNVYGVVVLGEFLNRAYLEEMKKLINRDIIIVKGNKIIESTIEDTNGNVKMSEIDFIPDKESFFYREIEIKENKGGFAFFHLKDYKDDTIAYIGVGSYFKWNNDAYTKNIKEFIIFEVLAFLIIFYVFYFIVEKQYKVFEKIIYKLKEIQSGDYGNKIEIETRQELKMMIEGINELSEGVFYRENKLKSMNADLETKVLERNKELIQMVHKMKGIERLAAVIYTEKDIDKTIEYILEAITSKNELDYEKAMFMLYDQETFNLTAKACRSSANNNRECCNVQNEFIINVANETNIITESFLNREVNECNGEYKIEIGKNYIHEKYFILPIYYESNSFGVLIIEKREINSKEDTEIIKIFMNNLAVYFETLRLQHEDLKSSQLKTLVKISSGIVHELRTPITTIRGLSSILMTKYLEDDRINRYVKIIIAETKRIDGMAVDLLSYAEGSTPKVNWTDLNINSVVGEALSELDYDLRSNNFNVEIETEEEVMAYKGDKKKLRQVFENIIKNAIEAGKGYKDSLNIKITKSLKDIKIEFEDSGVGINPNVANREFEPLVTSKIQGTGLGLTIARDILGRHNNSSIKIMNNSDGIGAVVEIILK